MVKAIPARSDYSSKDYVNLPSPTAGFRLNLETAVRDAKLAQDIELESLCNGAGH